MLWWAGPDLNRGPSARQADVELLSEKNLKQEIGALMENFFDFQIVDLKSWLYSYAREVINEH